MITAKRSCDVSNERLRSRQSCVRNDGILWILTMTTPKPSYDVKISVKWSFPVLTNIHQLSLYLCKVFHINIGLFKLNSIPEKVISLGLFRQVELHMCHIKCKSASTKDLADLPSIWHMQSLMFKRVLL